MEASLLSPWRFAFNPWAVPYFVTSAISAWLVVVVLWGGRDRARRWLAMVVSALGLTVLATAALLSAADAWTATRMARLSQVPAIAAFEATRVGSLNTLAG